MVLRMRELAVQMANGIYQDNPDRNVAQLEVDQLIQQIVSSLKTRILTV